MKVKYSVLLFFTLILSASIGFFSGAFPEIWRSIRGYSPDQILVLTSTPVFPQELLLEYQKKTGKTVVIKIIERYHLFRTEAQRADLLFAPLSWNQGILDFLSESLEDSSLENLQSSDFKTIKINLKSFMPTLWQVNRGSNMEESLTIWGFSIPIESSGNPIDFIRFMISDKKRLLKWSQSVDKSFTLKLTDTLDNFDPLKRASAIRGHTLSQLKIEMTPP